MSVHKEIKKITTHVLQEMKNSGKKISMLTSYDYSMAKILDNVGIDVILVGDSASNVICGNTTTLPITLDQMIFMAKSVANAAQRALVLVDMPFGTCSGNPIKSLESAIRIMQETGADALKIEGGKEIQEDVKKIIDAGIPVMSHLGLMPQSINKYGTYTVRAKEEKEVQKLIDDCLLMQELGCFGILLEKIPGELATQIASKVKVPVIGIGAGNVDGQVLVLHDMLGITQEFSPRFLRRYANLDKVIGDAVINYINDVKSEDFPNKDEQY